MIEFCAQFCLFTSLLLNRPPTLWWLVEGGTSLQDAVGLNWKMVQLLINFNALTKFACKNYTRYCVFLFAFKRLAIACKSLGSMGVKPADLLIVHANGCSATENALHVIARRLKTNQQNARSPVVQRRLHAYFSECSI